ncbi:MAG: carboxypeptidase-like regulatory domain-containing protein [Thermoguttaceae bacterium]
MKKVVSLFSLSMVVFALLVVSGCGGGDKVSVRGKVTYPDGKPMTGGVVVFDDGKNSANGEIKEDGTYRLTSVSVNDGIKPGTYKVFFAGTSGMETDPATGQRKEIKRVAPRFQDPAKSGLTCEVTKSMVHDIQVEYPTKDGIQEKVIKSMD